MIPAFDDHGLLAPGIHDCTLQDIGAELCWNSHRSTLFSGLNDFLSKEWVPLGLECDIIIDGSFVRKKAEPEDIDLVIDLSAIVSQKGLAAAVMLRLQHERIKQDYHCDLWAKHPLIPNDLIQFFQYLGDKGAADLRLLPKTPKGVLRIRA
jgi:hypothetical protein